MFHVMYKLSVIYSFQDKDYPQETGPGYCPPSSVSLAKKQGVSGQSVDTRKEPVKPEYHEKDFRAKTLMKEAIMENDFLKNLSPQQVRH